MQTQNPEKQFDIGRFTLPSLIRSTNRYLKDEPDKIYLLLPFLLFSTLSYFLLESTGDTIGGSYMFSFLLIHVFELLINAYLVLSMLNQSPGLFSENRLKHSLSRLFPQIKTELATFARGILLSLGISLTMMIPLGIITYLNPAWSESTTNIYILSGIIAFVVIAVMVRYLLSTTITILNPIEGFASVRLSVLLFKNNRLSCYLFFLLYFATMFGLMGLSFTQQNKSIQTLISMVSSGFSFYFTVMEAKMIEAVISIKEAETMEVSTED